MKTKLTWADVVFIVLFTVVTVLTVIGHIQMEIKGIYRESRYPFIEVW